MKKFFLYIIAFFAMSVIAVSVQANDYLELQKHYMVYTSGANKIHFKIPVWAYGKGFDYYLDNSSASYILLTKNSEGKTVESSPEMFCWFQSERYGENENKNTQKGTAWLKVFQGMGTVVVTSLYNGTTQAINDTEELEFLMVKQVEDDDCPYVSILEFDWYPPEGLDEKSFAITLNLNIYKSYTGNQNYTRDFRFDGPFSGSNNLMAPQLSEPYLYTVNGTGVTGYGQAAVQYTTFQQPIWYKTSVAENEEVMIKDRAGTIYINTTDTVQEQFTATFSVYRDEAVQTTSTLTAPPVDIPPFHRIYDFEATEQKDSAGSLTGSNLLRWTIKNPGLKDLVENDYFEIQRATESDFSDAQTINVVSMRRDENGEYSYVDDTYQTQANTSKNTQTDTIRKVLSAETKGYVLRDAKGNPMCELDLELDAWDFVLPSAPVYYRIRRAASSLWGWEHEFARADTVYKHNYLAPLASAQSNYIKDENYSTNHMVHFNIKLDNLEIGYRPISLDECGLSFKRRRTMSDSVEYTVKYNERSLSYRGYYDGDEPATIFVYANQDGEELFGAMPGKKMPAYESSVRVPRGCTVTTTVRPQGPYSYRDTVKTFVINDHTTSSCRFHTQGSMCLRWYNSYTYEDSNHSNGMMPEELARVNEIRTSIKQAALPALLAKNETYGKCIWDRTARLLLCRTNQETGQTVEIIVPQDSIRRLEDGSWVAHIADVADNACTHYAYSARIDQSDASIHVSDDIYLNPVPIYGEELYYDESATITSFTASQGATESYHKNGINLIWTASSSAVDEYVLTRIVKNSDRVPDTLLRTIDNNYFDETAQPNVLYEYTITALYNCNGKNSANAAMAEGWRTPYGQISGSILMDDNSGMAGVQVSISADGQPLKTITTDATGGFVFDSLSYDLKSGTVYTITSTSQYGVFSYNNTSSGSAAVTLAADQAIVSGVNFVNTSAVRVSGRVLYTNSTIPVAGVSFILNGDTVRRNGAPLLSANDGSFELSVSKSQMSRLQVAKKGHTFDNDGWLFVSGTDTAFSLVKALDGVRLYDATKVRLIGRVAGGNDQRDLPRGFGVGKNNLGDNLQLVLQLEGDNTAHIVHDPIDLTRDTLQQSVSYSAINGQSVVTNTIFEQKRIIIRPDVQTGEYAVDLFPVKYKVVQATANGYATLFPAGTGSETFDLTNAPLTILTDSLEQKKVNYNAVYDRIYHNPVQVKLTQIDYGMEADGLGEAKLQATSLNPMMDNPVPLYTKKEDGTIDYLLGYPVFTYNRRYQFMVSAYEEYLYNNNPSGAIDRVPQCGGSVTVQNGMSKNNDRQTYTLDSLGRNKGVWLSVDYIDVHSSATNALRTVSVALEREGNVIEANSFQTFVEGTLIQPDQLQSVDADIALLDIIRDPGGNGSSSYVESGTTYKFAYVESYHWKAGLNIDLSWSAGITQDIGVVAAPTGNGTYIGANYSTKRELAFTLPIVHEWKWGYKYDYTVTTTERISTSTAKGKVAVGANADVFLGVTTSQLAGNAKSIALISDSLFDARQPAIKAGTIKVLSQGKDSNGRGFYLVTGEKVVLGSRLNNTFAYSQAYIMQTIIPSQILQRQNLLMNFDTEAEARAMANATGEPVYWNLRTAPVNMKDTLSDKDYKMILPDGNKPFVDQVKALDNMIWKWTTILYQNEKEKVMARTSGEKIGTYSVNFGNSYTHSDSYSATYNYNYMPNGWELAKAEVQIAATDVLTDLLKSITNTSSNFLKGITKSDPIGTSVSEAIKQYYKDNDSSKEKKPNNSLGTKTNNSEFNCDFAPVVSYNCDDNLGQDLTQKKTAGFTLVADDQGAITVSVYRANMDSVWKSGTELVRSSTSAADLLYGSYVFFTEAGSTFCPYEPEERTMLYSEGTLLNRATEYVAKPELSIDTYEQTNIPSDQRAVFRIQLKNGGEVETGYGASGQEFSLSLIGASNPYGAKVLVNGAPLATPVKYFLTPGQTITQTIEVEKGQVDDYEQLQLIFGPTDCPKTLSIIDFSVHFLPESCPVKVASPRDKWVMNTLSPKDSIGYYLPITIDGFNIRHKNFDHIEFQYKLSTENDDAWVNQCSFYANDSLYALATGNKAMIENGRITPFRFYGERDPKELNYDLRAVTFCRYGSGFVTKSSPVISGTKDTRPPMLFGKAQPANGILTLEDNISLRFSEPIAGNWLDEDNNFQILGVTNTTGITQSTSLYFDGLEGHYATTKAQRELAITDLTIDMLIKPAEKNREMTLLTHGDELYNFTFSLTSDNRLKLVAIDDGEVRDVRISKPMAELSTTDFTRVIMAHNFYDQTVRFYAGTEDITDDEFTSWLLQNDAAPFIVGAGLNGENTYHGNIMEVRVWTKPLTPSEISNTHLRHLTGYEYGLMDYYPMNESKGNELTDLASGATLYAKGLNWMTPQGISLATDGKAVRLQPTLFSRTDAEDYTLLFWFRSNNLPEDIVSLFATAIGDSVTMQISLHDEQIHYAAGTVDMAANAYLTDAKWHHAALVISKSFNSGSLLIDGETVLRFPALQTGPLSGTQVWLAKGLEGNIDDLCLFEQTLPAELIQEFGMQSPNGEEMGLINMLTFSQTKRNASNVMELVFSPNNQRVFKDANGNTLSKEQPLLLDDLSAQADKNNSAPVSDRGQLTQLPFTWNYQLSDLLINIKAQPREINKRTMYLTVRDVEDINGNRLVSPVMWTVYADLNSVRWNERTHEETLTDNETSHRFNVLISNTTGMTRQYNIEHLPDWLNVSTPYGSLGAKEEKSVTFTILNDLLKIGLHTQIIYLTDDQGLSEPLLIQVKKETQQPYVDVDLKKYPLNMSLCGRVILQRDGKTIISTDEEDFVFALQNNECIGMAHPNTNGELYLTIFGNNAMERKPIRFQLWEATTGKIYNLTPDTVVRFTQGAVYGCADNQPVQLTAGGGETQTITLNPGWNWISTYLDLQPYVAQISRVLSASEPWKDGDIIKNPATQHFVTYSEEQDAFIGQFDYLRYIYTYMVYSQDGNTMRISGNRLHPDSMSVTLQGNGQWSALPCLFDETVSLRDALADYYDNASSGDIIKSHTRFATFSANNKWVGDLNALTPGEGYFLRRMGTNPITINFFNQKASVAPMQTPALRSNAATNMTIIANIQSDNLTNTEIHAYIGKELVGIATPLTIKSEPYETYYFLTVSTEQTGEIRFFTADGTPLTAEQPIQYLPNNHHGSLAKPLILHTGDNRPYKIIENDHVIIIRNNEKYSIEGTKL